MSKATSSLFVLFCWLSVLLPFGAVAALLGFLAAGFVATLRAGTSARFTGLLSIAATRAAGTAARAAAETGGLCKWCSGART